MNEKQVEELLYQALETEIGGQRVYEAAIRCAQNSELKDEWEKYLDETRTHEQILRETFERLKLDPEKASPGRAIVRFKAKALVDSMEMALDKAGGVAAELVAAECVVEAETKDHQNWELIGKLAEEVGGDDAEALRDAYEQVEEQEDQHLYHTMGWSRELWMKSLGMRAVLPPPEEQKQVTTAIGAERAKQSRDEMTKKRKKSA